MSWRDVFDGSKGNWKNVNEASIHALQAGYKYLAWNGEILYLSYQPKRTMVDATIVSSGIKFEELEH